jgi:23S rRNA (cytidine1920-2'-O)/16S rRNA (cytidine1409-2'-O)-methyltransferase
MVFSNGIGILRIVLQAQNVSYDSRFPGASQLDFSPEYSYPRHMDKERLDVLIHRRGLAESRERARRLIMAARVSVNGRVLDKPGTRVPTDAEIAVKERLRYVSRGGLKLEAAIDAFAIDAQGMVAADVGASTGGFTDCLLQRGAARVYAIDVGYGQLAWELRQDPRVEVMERVNVRYLTSLPEPIDLATVDVSFISLKLVLPAVQQWLSPGGQIVALIKPQFEAGRREVGKGGVVKDPDVHRAVLCDILGWAQSDGLQVSGLIPSPLRGPAGNVEFFTLLVLSSSERQIALGEMVERCLASLDSTGR